MRISTLSTTATLALLTSTYAAPTTATGNAMVLSKRQTEQLNEVIVAMNEHAIKRAIITDPVELYERQYTIVTQILAAINETGLAPELIEGLISNPQLQPLVTGAAIAIIKSGLISLNTLFTALNESGLATTVIQSLISDCTLYQDIFKLALQEISNLVQKIQQFLSNGGKSSKRGLEETSIVSKEVQEVKRYDPNGVVNNLLESLAQSGLASSVVRALIVDPQFLQYGVSLLSQLWQQGLIDIPGLISALAESGLVTSLFQQFFNLDTLKTIIFEALAAAFNQCGGSTISGTPTGLTTQLTTTTSLPSFTATATSAMVTGGSCNKKRKRRAYNY